MASSEMGVTGTEMRAGTRAVAGGLIPSTTVVLAEEIPSVTMRSSAVATAYARTLTAIWITLTARRRK
jgi:hypothetical protein